jgi:hypothetical protein
MLNEVLYITIYLNNNCICSVVSADGTAPTAIDYTVSTMFLKVAYQNNPAINMAIKNNIMTDGLIIPFNYISNLSFNDPSVSIAHQVSVTFRVYSQIGNKLRSIYLVPASLVPTAANVPIGIARLSAASSVDFSIDSNPITKYDNNRFENLIYCRLKNKYWSSNLQTNNFFLPIHFYDLNNDNDNLNEGLNITSD